MIDNTPPSEYLRPPPNDDDGRLAERVGSHIGDSVPFWRLGRVAEATHQVTSWASRREGVERWFRRGLATVALALAGNLWVGINTMQGRAADAGAARARAEDQATEIRELRLDLRAVWQRVTGVDPNQTDQHGGDPFPMPMEFASVARPPACRLTVPPEDPLTAS